MLLTSVDVATAIDDWDPAAEGIDVTVAGVGEGEISLCTAMCETEG